MQHNRPLITIAIPTYNRSALLGELLEVLAPQLATHPEIELLISDNASPDGTSAVVQHFVDGGLAVRYIRHLENIGADANFVSCFHQARGKYFWLFGDDDIIVPGAVDELLIHLASQEYDLVYVTSYGFRKNWKLEHHGDPFHRRFHTIADPLKFARVVNIMFTFISGIIVNKQRLEQIPHESPSEFLNTNLVQLSWALPLLQHHRRSLVLWNRSVGGRQGNAGGYAIGSVFGEKLITTLARCLPCRPEIAACITNFALRRWFPSMIYDIRASGNQLLQIDQAHDALKKVYGNNLRYWLFTYPVLLLPLPLARLWFEMGAIVSKLIYVCMLPTFWRKQN